MTAIALFLLHLGLVLGSNQLVFRQAGDVPDLEHWEELAKAEDRVLCYLEPDENEGNDGPAIEDALNDKCRSKSLVVFPGPVYHINSTMNTTELDDVLIHLYGRLLWTPEVDYWLTVSMPVEFQNQSTVWYFGGDSIVWDGHGEGTLDGNGQVWYDWAKGEGNLAHRPMNINYRGFNNSVVKRMRYVQSQMWTMAVTYSRNLLFEDIYVNNTSTSEWNTLNTDGVDTIYSDNITFNRWQVTNGDDAIALKGNSSNIFVYDTEIWGGQGLAIGSMGQFDGGFEHIEHFYGRNVTLHGSNRAMYLKTWSGNPRGYPPNGGGGGKGYARDIVLEDVTLDLNRQAPFFIHQCENYEGYSGQDCDSSEFHISDIVWKNVSGTVVDEVTWAANLTCSAAADGCNNITVGGFEVKPKSKEEVLSYWHCHEVKEHSGFECAEATEDTLVDVMSL